MCGRLKKIRKEMKLTQAEFAASIGLGQSTYAMIENGKRELLDRHVKVICAMYDINEKWFRTGEGDMFRTPYESFISELAAKYRIDRTVQAFVTAYLELGMDERERVSEFMRRVMTISSGGLDIPPFIPEDAAVNGENNGSGDMRSTNDTNVG